VHTLGAGNHQTKCAIDEGDMSDISTYVQQWERVIRWYRRFKEISERKNISQASPQDEDDVFAFFMNCHHLKDWIKNDPSQDEMQGKIEEFINNSTSLSICADLCNGIKHLTIDKSRSGQNPRFGGKTQRVYYDQTPIVVCQGYTIVAGNNTFDAFDLAFQCMMDWHRFIYLSRKS
jgi:hypothetical protein